MKSVPLQPAAGLPLAVEDEVRERVTPLVLSKSGLKGLVQERSGIVFEGSSLTSLCRAVTRRMQERSIRSVPEYEQLLRVHGDARELDELVALVVVLKTSLFRDRSQFDFLEQHALPEWSRRDRPLRIWSAGCATGEEAYSLAICLLDAGLSQGRATVTATDLSRQALSVAEAGIYPLRHLEGLGKQEQLFFRKLDDGRVAANDRLRSMIEFRHHNLVCPPYPLPPEGAWDAIFCRNVMIYFDRQTTMEILDRFHRVLAPGGLLFVGASESLYQLSDAFTLCDPAKAFIYRRLDRPGPGSFAPAPPVLPKPVAVPERARKTRPPRPVPRSPRPEPEAGPQAPAAQAPATDSGLEDLHRMAQQEPAQAGPRLALGRLAADKGSLEQARSWLEAGLEVDPLDVDGRFLLAVVLYRGGFDAEAADALRQLLFLDGEHALGHYYLGLVCERLGDLNRSRQAFTNALDALQADRKLDGAGLLDGFETVSDETLAAASRARLLALPPGSDEEGRER